MLDSSERCTKIKHSCILLFKSKKKFHSTLHIAYWWAINQMCGFPFPQMSWPRCIWCQRFEILFYLEIGVKFRLQDRQCMFGALFFSVLNGSSATPKNQTKPVWEYASRISFMVRCVIRPQDACRVWFIHTGAILFTTVTQKFDMQHVCPDFQNETRI